MRELVVVVLVALMVLLPCAPLSAEELKKPIIFDTKESCLEAVSSGEFTIYEPKWLGMKDKNPIDEKLKVAVPLEADACVFMLTSTGKRWVIQPRETMFRWLTNEDGSLLKPYALDKCGNPVYEIVYPTPKPAQVEQPEPTVVAPEPTTVDPVPQTVVIRIVTEPTPPPPPPITVGVVKNKKSRTVWYVIGAAVLVCAGVALASGGKSSSKGPEVTTLPPN